jgi:stearoyl-CoA desaturase (delta-9 desaturase)
MTQAQKLRYLQLLNHIGLAFGVSYAVYFSQWSLLIASLLAGLGFSVLGINIAYHRYVTHNSFETYSFIEKILLIIGCLCLVGSPLSWAISHMYHHAYTDKEGDPYSPSRIKLWDFLMTRFEPVKPLRSKAKSLMANKNIMFIHRHYFKIIGVYCLILALINPLYIIFFWSIPSLISLYLLLVTNIVCHLYGYRNHDTDDCSHNNIIMSILNLGEAWHNNHHHNPRAWRQGLRWWELDPTSWIIWLIKR